MVGVRGGFEGGEEEDEEEGGKWVALHDSVRRVEMAGGGG